MISTVKFAKFLYIAGCITLESSKLNEIRLGEVSYFFEKNKLDVRKHIHFVNFVFGALLFYLNLYKIKIAHYYGIVNKKFTVVLKSSTSFTVFEKCLTIFNVHMDLSNRVFFFLNAH